MSDGLKLPDAAVAMGEPDLRHVEKRKRLTPTVHRVAEEAHVETRVEVNQFGRREVVADVPLRVALEAMRDNYRMDADYQSEQQAHRPIEQVRYPSGEKRKVWSAIAEQTKQVGTVPAWRAGGQRVVTGPNGNLWRVNPDGTTEDTGKKCLTRPWFGEDEDKRPPNYAVVIH